MRKTYRKKLTWKVIFLLIGLLLFALIFQSVRIYKAVQRQIAAEKSRLKTAEIIPFDKFVLTPHQTSHIEIRQNTNDARGIVKFRDSYFTATNGGLLQLSETGENIRHFTVADGLAESDLTALAVFGDKLFIGTRSKNLITFDGEKIENYVWTNRQAQIITSFLVDENRLLIGTFAGGLIEFDGANFREIKAEDKRIVAINCVYKKDSRLFVGTFNNGIWSFEAGVWKQITTDNGLPSNRVVGITQTGENVFIATDFGIVRSANLDQTKPFHTINNSVTISSIAAINNQVFYTKSDGEVFLLNENLSVKESENKSADARLNLADDKLFLLTNHGIFQSEKTHFKPFHKTSDETLTDNFVSALAFDADGNLWAGTFRNGIDIFTSSGKKLKHIESETIREINFLQSRNGQVFAATSDGLLQFKRNFSNTNLTKKNGLPSNSITHFANDKFRAIATSKGLTLNHNNKLRTLSTVQGLPSNSIYTTLFSGKSLFAGTLGGLAEIQNNKVVRTFKDSNSHLGTNWVTALCKADERIFIGTYGGGIFELTNSGEIHSFTDEIGKFIVNPNALFTDGSRLYVGTLSGVRVLDLQTQKWSKLTEEIPSEGVFSITGDNENIYFGTTNGIAKINKRYFENGAIK
jgi:ligand-binding sensor domain-containing protein